MTANEFSGLLKSRGIKQTWLAKKHKIKWVSRINNVVRGLSKSSEIRKILADALGKEVDEIDWPDTSCNITILKDKNKKVK